MADNQMTETDRERTTDEPLMLEMDVSVPRAGMSAAQIENLKKLIASKETLIKHALDIETTEIVIQDKRITFPWFCGTFTHEDTMAYSILIEKLCDMARTQKRVVAADREVDNEKYAFRCFLLRLGLIGDEYKATRKILLKNLSGSSAFKSGRSGIGKIHN